jgi:hypothetical protein
VVIRLQNKNELLPVSISLLIPSRTLFDVIQCFVIVELNAIPKPRLLLMLLTADVRSAHRSSATWLDSRNNPLQWLVHVNKVIAT